MEAEIVDDVFVSVIGPGIELAREIYHFASPLGSAGDDMRDLGAEVTLFCAIMRNVRLTFNKPKSFRVSTTAYDDVYDVLTRGQGIFEKIRALLSRLQSDDEAEPNVLKRIGHIFKKTRILMWKESLRSCTATVQVMLTTMNFAERIASTTSVSYGSHLARNLPLCTDERPQSHKRRTSNFAT